MDPNAIPQAIQRLDDIIIPEAHRFLALPHVLGCGLGGRYVERTGYGGGSICVTFVCSEKQAQPLIPIPRMLAVLVHLGEGLYRRVVTPTDVVVASGEFLERNGPELDDLSYDDPNATVAFCGDRIRRKQKAKGSLGCFLRVRRAKTGKEYVALLSAAHVVRPDSPTDKTIYFWTGGVRYKALGKAAWAVGPTSDGSGGKPFDDFGIARVPSAAVKIKNAFRSSSLKPPIGYLPESQFKPRLNVHGWSSIRGERLKGVVVSRQSFQDLRTGFVFKDVYLVKRLGNSAMPTRGDSGMVWTCLSNKSPFRRRALGLHFGGYEDLSIAIPFDRIVERSDPELSFLS